MPENRTKKFTVTLTLNMFEKHVPKKKQAKCAARFNGPQDIHQIIMNLFGQSWVNPNWAHDYGMHTNL